MIEDQHVIEPKVFTPEELDMILSASGDRRQIDTLIMHTVNNLAAVITQHVRKEDIFRAHMGDIERIRVRTDWVEAQIERQARRNRMMGRVAEAMLIYALPLFLVFIAIASWDSFIATMKAAIFRPKL